jgi:hypothetical protein
MCFGLFLGVFMSINEVQKTTEVARMTGRTRTMELLWHLCLYMWDTRRIRLVTSNSTPGACAWSSTLDSHDGRSCTWRPVPSPFRWLTIISRMWGDGYGVVHEDIHTVTPHTVTHKHYLLTHWRTHTYALSFVSHTLYTLVLIRQSHYQQGSPDTLHQWRDPKCPWWQVRTGLGQTHPRIVDDNVLYSSYPLFPNTVKMRTTDSVYYETIKWQLNKILIDEC